MDKVNVYYNTRIIEATLSVVGLKHWNLPMNDFTFRLYKGSKNSIEIAVRNNDRKPVNLVGKQLIITITDGDTYTVLLQKPLAVRDAYAGSAALILSAYEIDDWPLGFLRYNLMMQHEDGSQSMLYIDQDEGASGFLEMLEGPNLGPIDSQACDVFTPVLNNADNLTYYHSTSFSGNAQIDRHNYNLMSFALYMTDWTGTVQIKGCVEDEAPTVNSPWFVISILGQPMLHCNAITGIVPVSFEASLKWVKIVFLPDVSNTGVFNQVLFRN